MKAALGLDFGTESLRAVNPKFARVVKDKMPGRLLAPGVAAGGLTAAMATKIGLREGTPVSAAIIDAHAGDPGAGAAEPGTLVMVMSTSSCHMLDGMDGSLKGSFTGLALHHRSAHLYREYRRPGDVYSAKKT